MEKIKPHITRIRERFSFSRAWCCRGGGITSFGINPTQAFRNWEFSRERIAEAEQFALPALPADPPQISVDWLEPMGKTR